MSLCSLNFSIGVLSRLPDFLFTVYPNHIEGAIGKHHDDLLTFKNQRNCKFYPIKWILENQVEKPEQINSTLYAMFRQNKIDLFSEGREVSNIIDYYGEEDAKFIEHYLEKSKVIFNEPYQIGQIIDKPTNHQRSDFLFFLFQNIHLFLFALIGYFMKIIISLIYFKIKNSFNLRLLNYKPKILFSFKISSIIFCLNLFLFIISTLSVNSIQTDKIILNTDQFIDSISSLLKTERTFSYFKEEVQLFSNAPINSYLYKLYKQKIIIEKNYLELTGFSKGKSSTSSIEDSFLEKSLVSYFLFMRKFVITAIFSAISQYSNNNQLIFIKSTSYYETLKVIHMRKNLDLDKKEFIHQRITRLFENGIYSNYYLNTNNAVRKFIKQDLEIYENLKDFINQYNNQYLLSGVEFDNLKRIFLYHLLLNLFILFIFLLSKFLKSIKNNLNHYFRRLIRSLNNYLEYLI